MIKLLYAYGKHQGELFRIWRDYNSFVKDTIELVAQTAFNNKLSQKALFLHYGYGVRINEAGQQGYTNAVLGGMNFWIDSFPDLAFEYDSEAEDEEKEEPIQKEKRKRFYAWLQRFNRLKGMQLFRTSNEMWNSYINTDCTEECPVWEPNVPAPQQLLEKYPEVAALLEAGNLINEEQPHKVVSGLWAIEQLLSGESVEKIMPKLRGCAENPDSVAKLEKKVHSELGVIFYAFLTGKFFEEVEEFI